MRTSGGYRPITAFALPWYAILVLPILFAAGMSMFDTADGCFMNFAYGWAFATPLRKICYNVTVTAVSVAVALTIGSGPVAGIASLDLNDVGFTIVGLFILTWAVALAVWRLARIEEKWGAQLKPSAELEAPAN